MSQKLAVDIGGTFVDAVVFDTGRDAVTVEKATTTPANQAEGVLNAVDRTDVSLDAVDSFVHGTTLGLNALLERQGARTGIITNEGFRDVYEIGRTSVARDAMYDITYQRPESLVPRRRRQEVTGRIGPDGSIQEPLDEAGVRTAAKRLVEDYDVETIAICFLHAYRNPTHERRAAEIVRSAVPSAPVSVSSDVSGEYREYERTSTAVLDAYIKPLFESYVGKLDEALSAGGFDGSFFITRSGGGALSAASATETPVHTILSGPSGGLIGAAHVGELTDRSKLISVDMGGTSLDACVIEDGSPTIEYQSTFEGMPIMIPVYDLRTIGAGGGSIAHLEGDLLKVGPRSAGADPGPICYDRGGTRPTVTDAALVLGYLDPDAFLGGEMDLDAAAARRGIRDEFADELGSSPVEVCTGIFEVTLANTVSTIREITVERGLDPREFTMVAYGGAGPMFIPLVGREMGVDEVLVPQAPAVFSAWGMLMADVVNDISRTEITALEAVDLAAIEATFEELESDARNALEEESISPENVRLERSVEMRYVGQEHAVEVPAEDLEAVEELHPRFEAIHERRYGHTMADQVEIVHLRIRAVGELEDPSVGRIATGETGEKPTPEGTREAYCFAAEAMVPFGVYAREDLVPGATVSGPVIITEPTTTIVVHGDQAASVDEYGHVVVREVDDR